MAQASAWPRELREVGESAAKVECLVLKLTALKNKVRARSHRLSKRHLLTCHVFISQFSPLTLVV
jgi:hypothetical protein